MGTSILIGLVTERVGMHHRGKNHLDFEILSTGVNLRPRGNMVSRRSRVIAKRLLGHSLRSCAGVTGSAVESEI